MREYCEAIGYLNGYKFLDHESIGFFYIFFFLYAGYMFLTAGGNPIKRAHAKDLLRNTVLMIVLIQGSYCIYGLVLRAK